MSNLSPKDKETLFNEICEYPHIVSHKDAAMELANQYSEQIAIGFAEWIAENARAMYDHKMKLKFWVIGSGLNEEIKSTTELFNLYKQSNK